MNGSSENPVSPQYGLICVSDDLFDIPAPARYADGCHHSFYFP